MWYLKVLKAIFVFILEISFDNKDEWNLKSSKFKPVAWVRFITFCCAILVIAMLAHHTTTLSTTNVALRKRLLKSTQDKAVICSDEAPELPVLESKTPVDKK